MRTFAALRPACPAGMALPNERAFAPYCTRIAGPDTMQAVLPVPVVTVKLFTSLPRTTFCLNRPAASLTQEPLATFRITEPELMMIGGRSSSSPCVGAGAGRETAARPAAASVSSATETMTHLRRTIIPGPFEGPPDPAGRRRLHPEPATVQAASSSQCGPTPASSNRPRPGRTAPPDAIEARGYFEPAPRPRLPRSSCERGHGCGAGGACEPPSTSCHDVLRVRTPDSASLR